MVALIILDSANVSMKLPIAGDITEDSNKGALISTQLFIDTISWKSWSTKMTENENAFYENVKIAVF